MKSSNRSKPEYINILPEKVIEIQSYISLGEEVLFNRYYWDVLNNRLIMKLKKPIKNNSYKVVHPMFDKYHEDRFVHMIDINDNHIYVNYDYLINYYSIGYYLSIENYDYEVNISKQFFT